LREGAAASYSLEVMERAGPIRWTRRAALGGAIGLSLAPPAEAAPRRIVSLNPCLDAILAAVADPAQIAALSHYARDPQSSTIAEFARRLPYTYESAEAILTFEPDLVLASVHSGVSARGALNRMKVRVATFGVPDTVADSLSQIEALAAEIGRRERGAALIARIEAALAQAAPPPGRAPVQALVFQPGGLAAGKGTLVDEMLRRTGFENVAARYGIGMWGKASLERVIADPPQMLLSAAPAPGASSFAERIVAHPALASIASRMRRAVFPPACMYCGGPVLLQTAAALVRARDDFWRGA
jgi:iron complex transport system substrate-binding protein